MAICLVVVKAHDGNGDVVQCVKIASYVEQFIKSSEYDVLKNEPVIILVPDIDNVHIASHFTENINPKIQVMTIEEFKTKNYLMTCCLEVGYIQYNWRAHFEKIDEKLPIIYFPEYDFNDYCFNGTTQIVRGGFDSLDRGDVGVIPDRVLLAATAKNKSIDSTLESAFKKLDLKIQHCLVKNFTSYQDYRAARDFTYQYCNNKIGYSTYFLSDKPEDSKENQYIEGDNYTTMEFFLMEHIALMGNSEKSQDVLFIGKNIVKFLKFAIELVQTALIDSGFTKVSLVYLEDGKELCIYNTDNTQLKNKEYRLLYIKSVPFSTMQVLPLLAIDIVGVTGDQSVVEAMSAKKLVSYGCMPHKKDFALGYLKAVELLVSSWVVNNKLEESDGEKVLLLARYLIKPNRYSYSAEYHPEKVCKLLGEKHLVTVLKKINRKLVKESHYFASIENILTSQVIPYIESQQNDEKHLPKSPGTNQDEINASHLKIESPNLKNSLRSTNCNLAIHQFSIFKSEKTQVPLSDTAEHTLPF